MTKRPEVFRKLDTLYGRLDSLNDAYELYVELGDDEEYSKEFKKTQEEIEDILANLSETEYSSYFTHL